jgi:hypothetical protein
LQTVGKETVGGMVLDHRLGITADSENAILGRLIDFLSETGDNSQQQ